VTVVRQRERPLCGHPKEINCLVTVAKTQLKYKKVMAQYLKEQLEIRSNTGSLLKKLFIWSFA
jgi:hypothetical protein